LIDIHILVISGILRTYFLFKGEYLVGILAIEMIIRIVLTMNIYQNYKITFIYSLIVASINLLILSSSHSRLPSALIDFIITKLFFFFFLNLLGYMSERKTYAEFNINYIVNEEKKYYFNILANMDIGLFLIKNSLIYYNKIIKDIYIEHKKKFDNKDIGENDKIGI